MLESLPVEKRLFLWELVHGGLPGILIPNEMLNYLKPDLVSGEEDIYRIDSVFVKATLAVRGFQIDQPHDVTVPTTGALSSDIALFVPSFHSVRSHNEIQLSFVSVRPFAQAVIDSRGDLIQTASPGLLLTSNLLRDQYGALAETLWPDRGTSNFSAVPEEGKKLLTLLATQLSRPFWKQPWFQQLRDDPCNVPLAWYYKQHCGNFKPWEHLLCGLKFWRNCIAHCSYADLPGYTSLLPPELAPFAFSGKIDTFLRSVSRPVEALPPLEKPSGKGEGGRSGSKGRGLSRPGASSRWSPIGNLGLGAAWGHVQVDGNLGRLVAPARRSRSFFASLGVGFARAGLNVGDAVGRPPGPSPPPPPAEMLGGRQVLGTNNVPFERHSFLNDGMPVGAAASPAQILGGVVGGWAESAPNLAGVGRTMQGILRRLR